MPASPNRRNTTKALLALTLASGGVAAAAYAGISATANSTSQRKSRSMSSLLHFTEVESGQNPEFSIIWMHGLGDEGRSFISLVKELDLSRTGAIRFIFPDAPMMPVTINNGYVMRAWYDVSFGDLEGKTKQADEKGVRASQAEIEKLIAREVARGVAANKIVIAGFSQGGAIALQTGLRHTHKLAGIMALSCYLPLADKFTAEANAANRDTSIFMAHGRMDPVVTYARATESRNILQNSGYKLDWHEYAMPHSVCGEEVEDIASWLRQVFA